MTPKKTTSGIEEQSPHGPSSMAFLNVFAAVGLVALLAVIFQALGSILKPFFVAAFLCVLLYPAISFLVRHRVPRAVAYILVLAVIVSLFYVLGTLISINVTAFSERLPFYQERLTALAAQALQILQQLMTLDRFGLIGNLHVDKIDPLSYISLDKISTYIGASLGSVVDIVGKALIVVFFMVFILMEVDRFPARVKWAYGERNSTAILAVAEDINRSVMKYLSVKTLISLIVGGSFTLILGVIGVDFFILWGIIGFLLNYIPYVGSIIATIFPVLMALVQLSPLWALIILALLIAVQFSIGNFVEPKIMGRELNLSPLVVLIALAFWGWLWGFVGMVLAIPITATIKIVMEHIPATRNMARFMSDVLEPPKEPATERPTLTASLFKRLKGK